MKEWDYSQALASPSVDQCVQLDLDLKKSGKIEKDTIHSLPLCSVDGSNTSSFGFSMETDSSKREKFQSIVLFMSDFLPLISF